MALMKIRGKEYYHKVLKFETFEESCRKRWDMSRSYAYRLIGSANVIDVVSPIGDIKPVTESQVRPLPVSHPTNSSSADRRSWNPPRR